MALFAGPFRPPAPAAAPLNAMVRDMLTPRGAAPADFAAPAGADALASPDSVSWRIFKNPLSLFIGGVAAVILELAEPRVAAGVWQHSSFRAAPAHRLARTGLAAMITVYGPRAMAEQMIAGVGRMHARVRGILPDGRTYSAQDPALLDWVQGTAVFGFVQAYHAYAAPLSAADRDRAYAETRAAAALYGATGAPRSAAQMDALIAAMRPGLRPSAVLGEFLDLMRTAPVLPAPMRPLQPLLIGAAARIVPPELQALLGLRDQAIGPARAALVARMGALADRVVLEAHPAVQSCRRLGLPDDYLYR